MKSALMFAEQNTDKMKDYKVIWKDYGRTFDKVKEKVKGSHISNGRFFSPVVLRNKIGSFDVIKTPKSIPRKFKKLQIFESGNSKDLRLPILGKLGGLKNLRPKRVESPI